MGEPGVWTQTGRAAAVSQLFLAHHRRLVGLASVFVDDRETAEEVVQDAFLTLYRRWRLLRDKSAAVAYLDQCVVTSGRQRLRRGRTSSTAVRRSESPSGLIPSAEQSAVVHQGSDLMWQAICSLPRQQREVVVLRYYLDQSEAEIADTLGISRGSVTTHASRALVKAGARAMTRTPVELIAAALNDHAEEAMSQTDTASQLQEVLGHGTELGVRRNRRTWVVGGLVAAALAVCGAALWPTGHEPDPATNPATPTRSVGPMNADEQLAHDFASTYFAFDRKRAATYVAEDATPALRRPVGPKGWLRQNRLDEALDTEFHLDGCFQIATVHPEGARIGCLYTVNILGLGELGRGPFSGNLFNVAVRDGKVVDFLTTTGANDYDELAWGPFWSWVEDTHASEIPALEEMDDPDLTPKEVTRMIRAWRQMGQAYVAALRSGEAG